jgi:hypothetical protein
MDFSNHVKRMSLNQVDMLLREKGIIIEKNPRGAIRGFLKIYLERKCRIHYQIVPFPYQIPVNMISNNLSEVDVCISSVKISLLIQ